MTKLRGHTDVRVDGDTTYYTWVPEEADEAKARLERARFKGRSIPRVGPKQMREFRAAGDLYQFTPWHWQIRKDGRIVANIWSGQKGLKVIWEEGTVA